MIVHRFKGGTGTSSRVIDPDDGGSTVGVLVQANYGRRDAIFLRTGRWARRDKLGPWTVGVLEDELDVARVSPARNDRQRLEVSLRDLQEELFNLRFQYATRQLTNHARIQVVRRDIARIKTLLRERALNVEVA